MTDPLSFLLGAFFALICVAISLILNGLKDVIIGLWWAIAEDFHDHLHRRDRPVKKEG